MTARELGKLVGLSRQEIVRHIREGRIKAELRTTPIRYYEISQQEAERFIRFRSQNRAASTST